MARRKKLIKLLLGVIVGVVIAQISVLLHSEPPEMCKPTYSGEPPEAPQLAGEDAQNLIFVGVMTASKYLETRAKAVYETWGRDVPGKIMFYSSESSRSWSLPLVALPDVDDVYPPQKKSFMMLKHMHDNYIDKYEWFLRADDDLYVKMDRLQELLRGVDSKKPWFIGQTGRGTTAEFGLLSLDNDENFCMGGPGVVFSRETLRRMAPHVDQCLASLYTTHEDVELGRCVRRFAGISCTWSYEMQVILYHNKSGNAAFTGNLKQKEVHRAITLHPVKQPQFMYRLDKYVKTLKIQKYQHESVLLHRGIASSMAELGYRRDHLQDVKLVAELALFPEKRGSKHYLGDTKLLGIPVSLNKHRATSLDDVLDWELISKNLYSYKEINPRRRIGTSLKEGLNDVVRDMMELINSFSKQRGRVIDFKEIIYGYWRLDPLHGVDLILDLLLVYKKYRGHQMTVQVRRHAYIQQTFTGIFVREMAPQLLTTAPLPVHQKIVKEIISTLEEFPLFGTANTSTKEIVNFILPLSGRFAIFQRFLALYEEICIKGGESSRLHIVLFEDSTDNFQKSKELILKLQRAYRNNGVTVTYPNGTFTRAVALDLGVALLRDEDLMLFIDVDMIFDGRALERIRYNTRRGSSVYFPIVYSLYNPLLSNRSLPSEDDFRYHFYQSQGLIDEETGFWREFGFGIAALYKSDYLRLGGFNLHISGWGYEDVSFFDAVVKSNLKVIRTADVSLIHVYHSINCDSSLDLAQSSMCFGTKTNMLGSLRKLEQVYQQYKHLFR